MKRTPFVVVCALVASQPFGGAAGQTSVDVRASTGPVAIATRPEAPALVLQGDGTIVAFDGASVGARVYRVPSRFFVADLATVPAAQGGSIVLTLNARNDKSLTSWVLQVRPDRQEDWTWMPKRGIYIGLAVDAGRGHIYAANSSDNVIYRLVAGKGRPVEVARVDDAERIGALALDARGQRLFVADMTAGRVYVVPLDGHGKRSRIDVPNSEEIRALAWSAKTARLYVADAGQEAVFVVDPEGRAAPVAIRDKRFREPAGLAASDDGVWLVDEGARAAFQIVEATLAVGRVVTWNQKK